MGTPTYTPLAEITLGSSAASVTFSSIDQGFRDLVLVAQAKATVSNTYLSCRINSDTGSNYSIVYARGNGSSASSVSFTDNMIYMYVTGFMGTSNDVFSTINFMDYSATDKHKSMLIRGNRASEAVDMSAVRWANTSAITSLVVSGSFAAGSTFALYGIAA